jgi:hypothetical protein
MTLCLRVRQLIAPLATALILCIAAGPRRATATKSAIADLDNYDPKSKVRFRLAVHPSRLAEPVIGPATAAFALRASADSYPP